MSAGHKSGACAGVFSANARKRVAVASPMSSINKSMQEQVREIRKLIEDAKDSLGQAEWALQTLEFRLRQEVAAADERGVDD